MNRKEPVSSVHFLDLAHLEPVLIGAEWKKGVAGNGDWNMAIYFFKDTGFRVALY